MSNCLVSSLVYSGSNKGVNMSKTMTKYQLDHFKSKVRRNFDPLIEEQELLIKQYKTDATEKVVAKLAKKMGADKILNEFRKAEAQLEKVREKARTFFKKKAKRTDNRDLNYNLRTKEERLSVEDCEEQLRDWTRDLVDREIRRRPEGQKLKQLEDLKQRAIDTVMESGTPDQLLSALDKTTKKIGIAWTIDTTNIKQISSQ